ncbi:hypothetical protein ABIE58_000696 [Roseovarius sp. MBR-78]|jgi:hypothetical protein|uniref:hypothetical protein n=1 Tax=Roseovarius sp. MBR-78 TaxID=3156460 RepID=UPI003397633D
MSTWISERGARRGVTCAALLLALPACLAPVTPQAPLTEAALGNGAVRLSAPRGYCIDADSQRRLPGGGAFVLLAPCTHLTGTPGVSAAPALMTVSVMPQAAGAPAPDARSLAAAVAPAPVRGEGQEAGLVYAQVMRGGEAVLPGGDPRHWRGARVVAGQLASLALYVPQGSTLTGREGRLLLGDLAAGLSAAAPVGAAPAKPAVATAPPPSAATPRRGVFARLFPVSN